MLENEGLTEEIRMGFITLLLSGNRSIHEMIRPSFQDQKQVFETQFAGMASDGARLLQGQHQSFKTTGAARVEEAFRQVVSFSKRHPGLPEMVCRGIFCLGVSPGFPPKRVDFHTQKIHKFDPLLGVSVGCSVFPLSHG